MTSDKTIKALKIIAEYPEITAKYFAREMWADSPAWRRSYNTGNGSTRGKGMWLSAGGFLAKLQKRGLVRSPLVMGQRTFVLTDEGKKLLESEK